MAAHVPYSKEWIGSPSCRDFKVMLGLGIETAHKLIERDVHVPDDTRIKVMWDEATYVAENCAEMAKIPYAKHLDLKKRLLMLRDMFFMVADEDTPYTHLILAYVRRLIERREELLSSTGYAPTVRHLRARKKELLQSGALK